MESSYDLLHQRRATEYAHIREEDKPNSSLIEQHPTARWLFIFDFSGHQRLILEVAPKLKVTARMSEALTISFSPVYRRGAGEEAPAK
jgi:hypothetical protein